MASTLPEDLWLEILKRVEVVSLLRFRSVCKSWNSLISSSSFFNTHHLSFSCNKSYFLFSRFHNSYAFYNPQDDIFPVCVENLRFVRIPFLPSPRGQQQEFHVIDVIHGVVCLSRQAPNLLFTEAFILWNPTIHKYFEIPLSSRGRYSPDVGFGFDARKNDFKVVRIRCGRFAPPDFRVHAGAEKLEACRRQPPRFEVFSTLEGRWRSLVVADHIGPFSPITGNQSCFINGSIHWIIQSQVSEKKVMLVFDCESEEFKTMELPPEFNRCRVSSAKLFITSHGMLSVWWTYRTSAWLLDSRQVEGVWVMEEYGVASSWKKLTPQQLAHFVMIEESGVSLPQDQPQHFSSLHHQIERSHHPLNGNVFKPSMFLMDACKIHTL